MSKKNDNLSTVKNLIWAAGILLSLAAVFVGFLYAAFGDYYYERVIPTVELGASEKAEKSEDKGGKETSSEDNGPIAGELNELKKKKGGNDYISSLYFLCDSTYSSIYLYGADPSKVWFGETGVLDAGTLSTGKIIFPDDGSSVTAANAAMISFPDILVIMAGSDGLAAVEGGNFKEDYSALIEGILSLSPDTQIICCSINSPAASYAASDGLTSSMIDSANAWLKEVCTEHAVWYADTASVICKDGYLISEYAGSDGRTLNGAGIEEVLEYLNSHALK